MRKNINDFVQLDEIQDVLIEYRQSEIGNKRFKEQKRKEKEYYKKYCRSEKFKEISKKHCSKRRCLGFVSLNLWFGGSEAHHLDEEKVLYIPKELHRSIYHDVFTGKNMSEINNIALEWFRNQNKY